MSMNRPAEIYSNRREGTRCTAQAKELDCCPDGDIYSSKYAVLGHRDLAESAGVLPTSAHIDCPPVERTEAHQKIWKKNVR